MQVVYEESLNSMIKACILKEAKGYKPVLKANLNSKDFFSTNDFELNQLLIEWDWINGTPHNISSINNALELALRHKKKNHELLFNVLSQALKFGVDYVLTRSSIEAKRFCNIVYSVREELRNAKLNMKFTHAGNTLLGKYFFSHNIADLLLDFYQKRFPNREVVIVNHSKAYSLDGSRLKVMPALRVPLISNSGFKSPAPLTLNSFF